MSAVLTSSSSKSDEGDGQKQAQGVGMRLKSLNLYGLGMVLFFTILASASALVTYQLYVNYFPNRADGVIALGTGEAGDTQKTLYFLQSDSTRSKLTSLGLTEENYLKRLKTLAQTYRRGGYNVRYVGEDALATLPPNAALFAFDALSLSDEAVRNIKAFLADGGFLFFNYNFGFHNDNQYRENSVIREITGLEYSSRVRHVKTNGLLYLTPRMLSPVSQPVAPKGAKIGVEMYDPLPVFVSSQLRPDVIATNWSVTSALEIKTDEGLISELTPDEAGVLWHGRYGKGNWVYSSLPSYSFFSSPEAAVNLQQLVHGIGQAATDELVVVPYPYLDAERVVFVSEDTEYKFESFQGFINAANRYKVPVTAFLVAELAETHPDMVMEASRSSYIELGSHSYTHKKILDTGADNVRHETEGSKKAIDEMSGENIMGFRPPREEIDDQMNGLLHGAGFQYVLEKRKDYQYPMIESEQSPIYVIPRSATDDYQYLVTLDWDSDAILQRMKRETELITHFDGIYSLSIHTHLMAYKKNIRIIERYFEYLNQHPEYTPMKGIDIIKRVKQHGNIALSTMSTRRNYILKISNNNNREVERASFRVFWPQGKQLTDVRSELLQTDIEFAHNNTQGYTDVTVASLDPESALTLIVAYE